MTVTTTPGPHARAPYLAAVAEALAEAPEAERAELLDDLAGHLAELEAEHGEGLAERLGSPSAYAAELVASAGLVDAPAGTAAALPSHRRRLRAATRTWWSRPWMVAVRRFAAEARPGWWVVRAWLAAVLVAFLGDGDELFPVPDVLGHVVLSALAVAGAVALSVRIGRTGGGLERAATVVGVLGLGVALTQGQPRTEYVYTGTMGDQNGVLTAPDGRPIWNIWPYDGEGNPLAGVLLFDQDGVPLSTGGAASGVTEPGQVPIPGLFPLPQSDYVYDPATGQERSVPVEPPAVSIPRLPAASSTTSTTTPTTVAPADAAPEATEEAPAAP